MIPVTRPFLPPKEEYQKYIDGIWQRKWLTNDGPLVKELELKLKEYLRLSHLLYVSNGTVAIQIAIKALGLKGKIITTPFSYVATTSAIVWEGCEPVFADIDKSTFNIDPEKIESCIDEATTAILATHCFGNSCDIDGIELIAKKYGLRVIYDAAHCFGSAYDGKSVFDYGDVSITSFHSTKLFHTVEGGAVITKDPDLLKRMAYMRNFGHDGFDKYNGVGINGKNSEFHAAIGLCNLQYIDHILKRREEQCSRYDMLLQDLDVQRMSLQPRCEFNYAYYPIVFKDEKWTLKAKAALEKEGVFPRRYFYPSLSSLGYVNRVATPVSDQVASCILCLPLFDELTGDEQAMIARILLEV